MSAQYYLQFIVNKGHSVLPPKMYQTELTKYILVPMTNLIKLSSFASFIKHEMDMLTVQKPLAQAIMLFQFSWTSK